MCTQGKNNFGEKMKTTIYIALITALITTNVYASEGIISLKSKSSVAETTNKLVGLLKSKGVTIFAKIDHQQGAKKVGLEMQPSKLIVFGNPQLGTRLMQCGAQAAIDLPMKALIWQDKNNQVWLSYNDMSYIMKRHNINQCAEKTLAKIAKILNQFARSAAN
jgi:uncharacterized protein (DUF302 family)